MRTTGRTPLAAVLLALPLLAACTGGATGSQPEQTPASSGPATPTATAGPAPGTSAPGPGGDDEPVASVPLTTGGGVVQVDVLPLVRVEGPAGAPGLVVLTLYLSVVEPAADGEPLEVDLGDPRIGGARGEAAGLRLLDLRSDQVHLLALDGEGEEVATPRAASPSAPGGGWGEVEPGSTARLQAVYAAPPAGVDAVSLLVPGAALVDRVPVVDGEPPAPGVGASAAPTGAGDDVPPGLDPGSVADAPTYPLETFTTELEGAVRTLGTPEVSRVDLATDVLFAFDSADLGPPAQAALEVAAEEVRRRGPGPVLVVGHTDDQGSEEYNLDLSGRRAQAVADALAPLLGPERPVVVEARGETEPVLSGTDEESRAVNRRVTLTVDAAPVDVGPALATAGELPPAPDLTASGEEGVLLGAPQTRPWRVRVPSVRLVEGHVVADVELSVEDDEVGSPFGPAGVLGGTVDPRGDYGIDYTATARSVVLLQGSTAVYSLDHVVDPADPGVRLCACDPNTWAELSGDLTSVSTVVFPAVEVGEEVTLEVGQGVGFRLTDIPVS